MPSVRLDLGKYVIVRPRADGTSRVLFEVPARLRPSGWLPTIALPIEGERRGDLTDPLEVKAIQDDARRLYAEVMAARVGGAKPEADDRSLARLIREWQASEAYRATKPRTQAGYDWLAGEIKATYEALPRSYSLVTMTAKDAERFLQIYNDRPSLKWHIRKAFRLIMGQAVAMEWRPANPFDGVKVKQPKSRVTIWEQTDVDAYAFAAAMRGQPSMAALILMEWEIGQRLTDAILFRRTDTGAAKAAEYSAAEGVFRFAQSKTANYVTIPISDRLRAILGQIKKDGSPYLFHDGATRRPFPDVGRLGHLFEDARAMVLAAGGRRLVLRALRHSCVVQLARHGCTVSEIASITGHSVATAESILSTYLPRDNIVAWNAQRKRGLIGAAS